MWKDVLAQPDSVAINTTALEECFAKEGTMSKIHEVPQQRKSVVSTCGCEISNSLLELFLPNLPNMEKGVISAQSNIHQWQILELDSALSNIFYLDPLEYP